MPRIKAISLGRLFYWRDPEMPVLQLRLWTLVKSEYGFQYRFAQKVKIREDRFSKILNGQIEASKRERERIAAAFGMTPDEIFER
jgi:hypothetical protein